MIYNWAEVKHSFNVIYKEEEHDVRFGILLSAMQDPYHKGILSGMSISQIKNGFRIDGGTFAYNGYIIQMFQPVLLNFPEISNKPRQPLPPIETTDPSIIPPSESVTEYPPGYVPPGSVVGEDGENPVNPDTPTTITTYKIKPALSVRICPVMETGEYGIVTKSTLQYLDKDLKVRNDDIDFTDTHSILNQLEFNKKAVRFRYVAPDKIGITEFRRIYNNTSINDKDINIKIRSDFHFTQNIKNVELTNEEPLDTITHSMLGPKVTNPEEANSRKDAIINYFDNTNNNSKISSNLHPFINSEVIITLNSSETMIGVAVDKDGDVYLNDWNDFENNQSILSYKNNKAVTVFYDENLIIDYRGLSPINEFKVIKTNIVTAEEYNSPSFKRFVRIDDSITFQNELDNKAFYAKYETDIEFLNSITDLKDEDNSNSGNNNESGDQGNEGNNDIINSNDSNNSANSDSNTSSPEDENSNQSNNTNNANEFNLVSKYEQNIGFFEFMEISTKIKLIDSNIKQKYYHLQVIKHSNVWVRGIKGIIIEDTSTFNSILDEAFIGYSYSFNGADNWLYVNNVNSEIVLRFPSYDPVLSAPVSASILNVLFSSTNKIFPYHIGYRKIVDASSDPYANNMGNDFIKELDNLNIMIITDDNNAIPGDKDGDGKIDVNTSGTLNKGNSKTETQGSINSSNEEDLKNLLELTTKPETKGSAGSINPGLEYNPNSLNIKINSLTAEELNKLIAEGIVQSDGSSVYNKVVFTFIYYHSANKIQFYIKDAYDLTQQDCIIGTLVAPTKSSFYLTYRDYEYPRMMPYAEWNQADTIVYAASFVPSFGNFIPLIKLDKVDKDKINPGTTDPDAPNSPDPIDPGEDVKDPNTEVIDGYFFEVNPIQTPTINNTITYSGKGTNGLKVEIIDYQNNKYYTTIENGVWKYKVNTILPDGLYVSVFKVYDEKDVEPMVVATGRTNAFRIDTVASIALNFIKDSNDGFIKVAGEVELGSHLEIFLIKPNGEKFNIGELDPLNTKFEFKNKDKIIDGTYTVAIEMVDSLGNMKTVISNEFVIDSQALIIDDDENPAMDDTIDVPASMSNDELVTATLTQYVEATLMSKTLMHDFDKCETVNDFDSKSDMYITNGSVSKYYIGLNNKQTIEFTFNITEEYSTFMLIPVIFGTHSDYAYDLSVNSNKVLSEYSLSSTLVENANVLKVKVTSKTNKFILLGMGLAYNSKSSTLNDKMRVNHQRDRTLPIFEYIHLDELNLELSELNSGDIVTVNTSFRSHDINGENCQINVLFNDSTYLYSTTEKMANNVALDIKVDDIKPSLAILTSEDTKRKYYKYPIKYVVTNTYGSNVYYRYFNYSIVKASAQVGKILQALTVSKNYTELYHEVIIICEVQYDGTEPVIMKYYANSLLIAPSFQHEINSKVSTFQHNFALSAGDAEVKIELWNKHNRILDTNIITIQH